MKHSATYSPDDNKLRLYPAHRLDPDEYARVKAAGFAWAPRQELFVAGMWTPAREDLLLELCGEIGDEDTSLVERAEQRAERFEGYSERRGAEATATLEGVRKLADGIPLGQPILVGHHSEKHARKDAEKIDRGMRQAVRLWETSHYWTDRAAGALRHAKYKEAPPVRARRIKGLEAEERKQAKIIERARGLIEAWRKVDAPSSKTGEAPTPAVRRARAVYIASGDGGYYLAEYQRPGRTYCGPLSLWEAAGGNIDNADPETRAVATVDEVRDRAIQNHESTIAHATRWLDHFRNRLAYERAMLAEAGGTLADQKGPEKGGACRCWASPGFGRGWSYIQKVNKVSVTVLEAWGPGRIGSRTMPFDKLAGIMTAAEVQAAREAGRIQDTEDGTGFYLLDPRPEPEAPRSKPEPDASGAEFRAVKEALRTGQAVQVVTAPQLFPTPPDVARQVVELADIQPGQRTLEPSAGAGDLLRAAIQHGLGFDCGLRVVAVEVNPQLAESLEAMRARWLCATDANFDVRTADFLTCNGDLGTFDRIIMNPPFENAADVRHIEHARHFLKPGGRLVAVCANGPRQREQLQPIAREWVDLPAGSFKQSGTMVNAAIVVIDAPEPQTAGPAQLAMF